MKLLIDTANLETIKGFFDILPMDGVTTNPSILAESAQPPFKNLRAIRNVIGDSAELHVQVVSHTIDGMVAEAHHIIDELGGNTFIKIPTVAEGIKAMRTLVADGFHITATAIYTPMQAYLAGKAGASYAAPYVNRIDNLGANGVHVARDIHDIYKNNAMSTEVLVASFKNTQQLLELCLHGIGAATVAPDVIVGLIHNDSVRMAIEAFTKDFEHLCGRGKTMIDCE